MSYKTYTSEFKAKVVIEVLQGEKSLLSALSIHLPKDSLRNYELNTIGLIISIIL